MPREPIRVEVFQPKLGTSAHRMTADGLMVWHAELSPDSYAARQIALAVAADARDRAEDPFDGADENVAFFEALDAVREHPDHGKKVPDGE